jgi:L-rhamnose mutarotase
MKRYAFTVLLKDDPEVIRRYDEYHENVWPEVLDLNRKMGVKRNYIFRFGRQLFMFLEAADDFDLERDIAKYADNPRVREWDTLMRGFQQPVPGAPEGSTWVEMREVCAFEA